MEYCRCGSVGNYIKSGVPLTEEELKEIVSCCLLGLHHLHSKKIIHRVIDSWK